MWDQSSLLPEEELRYQSAGAIAQPVITPVVLCSTASNNMRRSSALCTSYNFTIAHTYMCTLILKKDRDIRNQQSNEVYFLTSVPNVNVIFGQKKQLSDSVSASGVFDKLALYKLYYYYYYYYYYYKTN